MTTIDIKGEFLRRLQNPRGHVFPHELLKAVAKASSRKDKIEMLQAYAAKSPVYNTTIAFIVQCLYRPDVEFALPAGDPPFKQLDAQDETIAFTNLFSEMKKIGMFLKGSNKLIANPVIRERTFIQTLEKLCPREAKLILMMKAKKLDKRIYPNIDEKLFREAFPTFLPEPAPLKNESKTA